MKSNNQKPTISVIVPIYNSEQYLSVMIDSILAQTFTDYELLLIDDGSTDNSSSICDQYSEKDQRVHTFHKKNGGLSDTRNYGLDRASGKYIIFADSDDYIFPECFEKMITEGDGYDLLICSYLKSTREDLNNGKYEHLNREATKESIKADSIKEMADIVPRIGYKNTCVWNQLFLKSIIDEHNIRFDIIEAEDEIFSFNYFQYINSVKRFFYEGYIYIDTPNSLSKSHLCIVEKNWIDKMERFHENILSRFSINDEEYNRLINYRMAVRMSRYIMKGYYRDTRVPFMKRISRWREIRNDEWVRNRFALKELSRFDATVIAVTKSRLYWLLDPLFIIIDNLKLGRYIKKYS